MPTNREPRSRVRAHWPLRRKLRVWAYQTLLPIMAVPVLRLLAWSTRWRIRFPPELTALLASGEPFAVAIWHGDMLLLQALGRVLGVNRRAVVMVSLSQAGEVEARILRLLGYDVVRGSSKRRGREALEAMVARARDGAVLAFVVDGPSGPARVVKPGVIRLARRCQVPVVPVSFPHGAEWKLRSWDATRIPRPFSRCTATSTGPIQVPAELGDAELEAWTQRLAEQLSSGSGDAG